MTVRRQKIEIAMLFLLHTKGTSTSDKKVEFLTGKGLSREEIDAAMSLCGFNEDEPDLERREDFH